MSSDLQDCVGSRDDTRGVYLFVLNWSPDSPGGVNEVVLNLAIELEKEGKYKPLIAVTSWTPIPFPATVRGVAVVNIQLHDGYGFSPAATAKSLMYFPADLIGLSRFLRKNNVKVVNPHFPTIGAAVFPLLRMFRLYKGKVILSFHGADVTAIQESKPYLLAGFRLCLRGADGLVACSKSLAESLAQIIPEGRTSIVHNGADLEMFSAGRRPRSGPMRILHIGKFEHKKAQDVLLVAFRSLLDSGLDVELTMIGATGPTLEQTRRLAAPFGNRVHILVDMPHEELPEYYSRSDLFVLPSRQEPFGIVLIEAGAAGLPVVATQVGGIVELLRDENTGLLVKPEDPVMLADAIRRLLADEALSLRLAAAWHREAMNFTWASMARGYLDVLGEEPVTVARQTCSSP